MNFRDLAWRTTLAVLASIGAVRSGAAASPDWHGLRVRHEVLDTIDALNGVPVHMERFSGVDVPRLLERWLEEWRVDPRTAGQRSGQSGMWQLHSRLASPASQEVLQLRRDGESPELLWSRIELGMLLPRDRSALRLPADCRAGPDFAAHGAGAFEVSIAICSSSPSRTRLALAGRGPMPPCAAESGGTSICMLPLPWMQGGGGSALVILRSPQAGLHR